MRRGQELVLLYEINGKDRERKLKLILVKLGIRIKLVQKEEYLEPLAYLAKLKESESGGEVYEGKLLGDEMMVLVGFSSGRIDALLSEIRKAKLDRINLKAVLTDYNKEWNSIQLCDELKKEHEAMAQMRAQQNTNVGSKNE